MSIKPAGDLGKIVADEIDAQAKRLHRVIVRRLTNAGEQAVNAARSVVTAGGLAGSGKPYKVQTGNLVSSVGYILSANGQVVSNSSFEAVSGTAGNGSTGSATGLQYAKKLVAQYPTGYALILVAGMHYASYVQDRGYDVLASGQLIAERLVNQLRTKLASQNLPSD